MSEQNMTSSEPRPLLPISLILRILLVVAALAIATLLAIRFWPKSQQANNGVNGTNSNQISQSLFRNSNQPENIKIDTDGDGLTDEEEAALGTDPKRVDSDNDGLYDYEEVKVYKTKPLIADTDSDGHTDGDEVRQRYNPNGPGMLFELSNTQPNQ